MADNGSIRRKLQDGINAAKSGDHAAGRKLLTDVLEQDPENELAWIWLASCVTTIGDRRACLQRVLEINPNNARARQALAALNTAKGEISAEQIEQVRRARSTGEAAAVGSGGGIINILIAGLVLVVLLGAGLLFSPLGPLGDNGDEVAVVASPTRLPPTPLPTEPLPTRTPILFDGTSGAPTLPPTFTPLPTDRPTPTPFPTETPYPPELFYALYTSLEEGQPAPYLYSINGDGSNETYLGEGFRDVVYDPSGENIAFVRDVEYPPAEEGGEPQIFPELFVAPASNPSNATQLTELKAAMLGSPTWSPEGRELLFVNNYDGNEDLWYITPDGQNLWQVTKNSYVDRKPTWQPVLGSRLIVFASDVDSFGTTEIYSFTLGEPNTEMPLTRLTSDNNSSYDPIWSPDGTKIAFVSDRTGDPDIYVMDADGGNQSQLTIDDNNAEDRAPEFLPDSRYVAFISNRQDDRFQTYFVSLRGDVLVRLTTSERDDISISFRPELILRIR